MFLYSESMKYMFGGQSKILFFKTVFEFYDPNTTNSRNNISILSVYSDFEFSILKCKLY